MFMFSFFIIKVCMWQNIKMTQKAEKLKSSSPSRALSLKR